MPFRIQWDVLKGDMSPVRPLIASVIVIWLCALLRLRFGNAHKVDKVNYACETSLQLSWLAQ